MTCRPQVIVLIGAYWPGHESAGPNLSVKAMCETLGADIDFSLVARDRPFGAATPMVESGRWHDLGFARIQYLRVGAFGAKGLAALLDATPHDLIFTNGFFDKEFTIPALAARRIGGAPYRPVLLSPRGEFSSGALGLKSARKIAYRALVKMAGLARGVVFHVTSEEEEADVRAAFPGNRAVRITNVRPVFPLPLHAPRAAGAPFRVAFLGRISPVKGLDVALDALRHVRAPIDFSVYGPISDSAHWERCERIIAELPPHIRVQHRGEITNAEAGPAMAQQDLLFLPSRSENFGHAIFESLCAGTPVLIGDKTPWRDLVAAKAGFDIALPAPERLADAIDTLAALTPAEGDVWRRGARALAEKFVRDSTAPRDMRALLQELSAK